MNFRRELINILTVLATPSEVFEQIKIHPRWRAPVLVTLLTGIAIGWCMIPAVEQPLQNIYERSFGIGAAVVALDSMMKIYVISEVVVRTGAIFVRWILYSFALYGIAHLLVKRSVLNIRQIISLVAYSEIIFIAMSVLTVFILYLIGLENIETSSDTVIFKGVDFFLDAQRRSMAIGMFLSNLNVFSIWYILLIGFGISMFTGENKRTSIAIAGFAWCCWSLLTLLEPIVTESFLNVMMGI